MKRDEAEKLLGGYATGTLTSDERRALTAAALSDQQLFDALADEEALRDLLAQPGTRARLLDAVAKKLTPWERAVAWIMRPAPMGTLAGLAAVAIAVAVFIPQPEKQHKEIAGVSQLAAEPQPQPQPAGTTSQAEPLADLRKQLAVEPPQTKAKVSRDAAEEREAVFARSKGGGVGGVIGGIIGTVPGAPPPPPPPSFRTEVTTAPPAPVRAEAPAAPPAPQQSFEAASELGRARTASASALADAPAEAKKEAAPPLRYRLERLASTGDYATVAPASTFREGESIRLIVEPAIEGWLQVQLREGTTTRTLLTTPVVPGKSYTAPPAGALPAGAGDRKLLLLFTSTAPGMGQTALSFRTATVPPGTAGVRQDAGPARQNEADQLKSARAEQPVMIEIPLSYK